MSMFFYYNKLFFLVSATVHGLFPLIEFNFQPPFALVCLISHETVSLKVAHSFKIY
jgi:hypothetical protein